MSFLDFISLKDIFVPFSDKLLKRWASFMSNIVWPIERLRMSDLLDRKQDVLNVTHHQALSGARRPNLWRNWVRVDPNFNVTICIRANHLATDSGITKELRQISKSFHNLYFFLRPSVEMSLLRLNMHFIRVYMVNWIGVLVIVEHPTKVLIIFMHSIFEWLDFNRFFNFDDMLMSILMCKPVTESVRVIGDRLPVLA